MRSCAKTAWRCVFVRRGIYDNLKEVLLRWLSPSAAAAGQEGGAEAPAPLASGARRMAAELVSGCVTGKPHLTPTAGCAPPADLMAEGVHVGVGAVCGWVTNPLDMVKTRLMVPVRQATPNFLPYSVSVWSAQEPQSSAVHTTIPQQLRELWVIRGRATVRWAWRVCSASWCGAAAWGCCSKGRRRACCG